MPKNEEIRKLPINNQEGQKPKKHSEVYDFGGRKLIIVIFLLCLVISILFWLKGNLLDWSRSFWGSSKWSFSR